MTLAPRWVLNGLDLTASPFMVVRNGSDPGAPETIRDALASMLADGDIELIKRRGNRTYEIPVWIEGSLAEIDAAEADLVAAVEREYGELVVDPGDGSAPVSVFETFAGDLVFTQNEDADSAGLRHAVLTIPCKPFARPTDPITIDAPAVLPDEPETETVDDGSSTTGWSVVTPSGATLSAASGKLEATAYGGQSVHIARVSTGIDAAAMAGMRYLVVRGTFTDASGASFGSQSIQVFDPPPPSPVPLLTQAVDGGGNFELVIDRATGFSNFQIRGTTNHPGAAVRGVRLRIVEMILSDGPLSDTGKVQSRQVEVYGSQRTELSLSVLGLDAAGTTPVGLGPQVLIGTAAAGSDGRPKFLACRAAASLAGTTDTDAVSGAHNTLATTSSPTSFAFSASSLLPGNYYVVASLRPTTAGNKTLYLRGLVSPSVGDDAYDPATGWKSVPLSVATSGWPAVAEDTYALVDLGQLRLPPADVEDPAADIAIQVAASTASAVDLDDVYLLNADVGQVSILLTGLSSGSYSAVRLDAATVDSPQAMAYVGVANSVMVADPTRWIGEQHAAAPGLLQLFTVTPGCSTTRVSAHYFPRFHTHAVDLSGLLAA